MVSINLGGTISAGNVQPVSAYGILRSSFLPVDAVCLAVQGAALGVLFGNPLMGAMGGVIMSLTDRLFTPAINKFLPGKSYNFTGIPLGTKNISLAAVSTLSAISLLKRKFQFCDGCFLHLFDPKRIVIFFLVSTNTNTKITTLLGSKI